MRTGHFKEATGQLVALSDSRVVWFFVALLLAACVAAPFLLGNYQVTLMVSALIAVIGAVGLNMLTGTTGLISLGQAGFLAVGAYTNAILMMDYGWPVWLSLPAGGLVAALISILVGVPSLRLKGLYLAITTLAFAFIINHIILYAEPLTHGPNGIFVSGAKVLGVDLQRGKALYYLTLGTTVLVVLAALNIQRSRVGRAWMAIRDHDIAARVMGVDLVRYKLLAFMVSSFIVGIAGGLISLQIRFVNIDVFALILSIEALAIIILGGLGSIAGAVLGALFLSFLPEVIRLFFETFADSSSNFYTSYVYEIRGIAYGVVIVAFLRLKPEGLIGLWRDIRKYWSNWPLAY
ncbi:branched-chain amino acid ABC transporter permease [Tianweitania sediminis]|uniref:Branched-chain amino acid ABC transporter permease n=1 Tax=Tianweitania sediminis TaxID=1502156 RepID=A0A8J7R294_9HYPH|nr:branched-chain amino acid ABC transporter permease [Tianweitania sediminis]MBP0440222.1 branched-chain amino acid ABC transporter permease [Tianweitania sediminis]